MERVPLCPDLWVEDNETAYLIGSTCKACGEVFFPKKQIDICSYCQSEEISEIRLSREGKLLTFSNIEQKPAGGFYKGPVPFIYAMVELDTGVIVQTHITEAPVESLKIGQRVELVIKPLYVEDDKEVVTFMFRPVESEGC